MDKMEWGKEGERERREEEGGWRKEEDKWRNTYVKHENKIDQQLFLAW